MSLVPGKLSLRKKLLLKKGNKNEKKYYQN